MQRTSPLGLREVGVANSTHTDYVVGAGDYCRDRFGQLEVHAVRVARSSGSEATEQCLIIVLDELGCCWSVRQVQTSPNSTTFDVPLQRSLDEIYE